MTKRQLEKIRNYARDEALKVLAADAKKVLPKGWTLCLMVGWGAGLIDDKGIALHEREIPAKYIKLIELADWFETVFMFANERIKV